MIEEIVYVVVVQQVGFGTPLKPRVYTYYSKKDAEGKRNEILDLWEKNTKEPNSIIYQATVSRDVGLVVSSASKFAMKVSVSESTLK